MNIINNKEIIEHLKNIRESIDSSIRALETPIPKAKWIEGDAHSTYWHIECSNCGHRRSIFYDLLDPSEKRWKCPNYCENCGKEMEKI